MEEKQSYVYNGVEFYPTQFKDGVRLKTEQLETNEKEFKGFGKVMIKSKLVTDADWNLYSHQIPELESQMAAMMNTNGGSVFLGVGKNGVIKGGDYTYEDKENLLSFLKNFTIRYNIAGKGLIKEPEFYNIPHKYVSTFPNQPNSTRCLVVIKLSQSKTPVYIHNVIYLRDLGGVAKVDYETWFERRYPNSKKVDIYKQLSCFMHTKKILTR